MVYFGDIVIFSDMSNLGIFGNFYCQRYTLAPICAILSIDPAYAVTPNRKDIEKFQGMWQSNGFFPFMCINRSLCNFNPSALLSKH